jgi:hypothetical protein
MSGFILFSRIARSVVKDHLHSRTKMPVYWIPRPVFNRHQELWKVCGKGNFLQGINVPLGEAMCQSW